MIPYDIAVPHPRTAFFSDEYRAGAVLGTKTYTDHANNAAKLQYELAVQGYLNVARRNRELGIAPPEKPIAPRLKVVNTAVDAEDTLWIWITLGGPVGEPCPDLEPLPPIPPPGAYIGRHVFGNFYQALKGDTQPDNALVDSPPTDAPLPGTYRKRMFPFGGWYEKEA